MLALHAQWKWWKDYRPVVIESVQQTVFDEFMRADVWGPIAPICTELLQLGLDPANAPVFCANRWLGLKRTDTLSDDDTSELLAWDTSALAPVYGLVRLALLDDLDELILRLPYALAAGQITAVALLTWPVFAELRADARLAPLLAERGQQ